MKAVFKTGYLKKRFPLIINRGTSAGNDNLFICVTRDGFSGWGEVAPGKAEGADTVMAAQSALQAFLAQPLCRLSVYEIHMQAKEQQIPACARAGLDIALWDWLGKKANLPLYRLLGLGKPVVPTSITLGINPPEVVRERVPLLLDGTGIRALKIKLGSPQGTDADQAMFSQVLESTRNYNVTLRVDANGGWNFDDAIRMMKWLSMHNVDYVEQPLKEGQEEDLPALYKGRQLPIYADESCRFSCDIPKLVHCVDGINLKLMKCGGVTEALRIIHTAKALGLKIMIGCMGESSMSISAAAAITGLLDHVDLDSHLNLDPDPCSGAALIDGIITPNDLPGHGATLNLQT